MRFSSIDTHINGFLAAVQFITILPAGGTPHFQPHRMIAYFPVVGLLLGCLVSMVDMVAIRFWPTPVVALLDVILLAVLTAGLHLDGLGDTADGLLGHHSRERALDIMKDSRIGTMALLAVLAGLSIKWAGISGLPANRSLLLALIPAYARSAMLFAIMSLPYGRRDGTGKPLFSAPLTWQSFWAVALVVCLSLGLGPHALIVNLSFAAVVAAVILFYRRRMGCVTGDMLGAITEITEATLFLMVSAGGAA
jgi:adenosylcobinamide-GDP ribazoletransferase